MITGCTYGVVLNDRGERTALATSFKSPPYKAPPEAPVVYIKPRNCITVEGAAISAPEFAETEVDALEVAATIAVVFAHDLTKVDADAALAGIGAARLAIDVCVPHASYYRPAIAERCRDGFLPLGESAGLPAGSIQITTFIDDVKAHSWSLDYLVRPIGQLISDLSQFMTLCAGDALLVGLPGDAPQAGVGQTVRVEAEGFPTLTTRIESEARA